MNYYDKLLKNLNELVISSPKEALRIINEELSIPYVPKDVISSLCELKDKITLNESDDFKLSLSSIENYLYQDEEKQYIAVEELSKLNLRDYNKLISDYLLSDGSISVKVKLILAMSSQDISQEYTVLKNKVKYTFIPKDIILPDNSEYYKECINELNSYYMKNPDKLLLAKDILYKDYLLNLPLCRKVKESHNMAYKIIEYVNNSFNA